MPHSLCKARISDMNCQKWKFFEFKKIFDIRKGKRLTKADMVEGNIPYIGATDSNNGLTARISNDEYLHSANTISVSYNGSIAEAFYQTKDYWATDDVNVLYPKFKLNKEIALFLTTIINREKYRFNYGRKWDKESMETSQIKLPAFKVQNGDYEPDWTWIENYVKNDLVKKLPKRSKEVWQKIFNPKPVSQKKPALNTNDWKWFELHKLFSKERGTRLTKPDREAGNIPLITAGSENEGIADYISNSDMKIYQDAITIDMFGFSCYRGFDFCCDDNILVLKSSKMNIFSGLFIASVINKDDYKCAYGRQYRQKTFDVHKIKLPAVEIAPNKYEPDWQFMEDYIKSLPYSSCL